MNKNIESVAWLPRDLVPETVNLDAELYLEYKRDGLNAGMTEAEAEAYALEMMK